VLDAAEEHRAHHLMAVPAMLRALLAHPRAATADLSSLRVVASGGDAVPPDLIDACERAFGAVFSTVYGQTELSPVVTQTSPADAPEDQRTTAGRPLPNVDVAILDPSTREVLPFEATGEICARGYQAMVGYLDMPDETARTIDADGWVHTGDLGSLDARGYLRVTGRLKDLIIRGGENIYPREVEQVLLDHPAVSNAVVLGVPTRRGESTSSAVVSVADDVARPRAGALRDFVRDRLAPHKTPKAWFVADAFPTNAMGKLQKFRLLAELQGGRLERLDD
jgi:acyl-CoA synthetase (AMP-forming)/AMP-acid ligase II